MRRAAPRTAGAQSGGLAATIPNTTPTASASDYLKNSIGEMNKVLALLRVKGDMGKVRPFFACFEKR